MNEQERQELSCLIKNAKLQRHRARTVLRFNGAAEGCPPIYQIQVRGELYGWFETKAEASSFIRNAKP